MKWYAFAPSPTTARPSEKSDAVVKAGAIAKTPLAFM
jgi:hypothetical protein